MTSELPTRCPVIAAPHGADERCTLNAGHGGGHRFRLPPASLERVEEPGPFAICKRCPKPYRDHPAMPTDHAFEPLLPGDPAPAWMTPAQRAQVERMNQPGETRPALEDDLPPDLTASDCRREARRLVRVALTSSSVYAGSPYLAAAGVYAELAKSAPERIIP